MYLPNRLAAVLAASFLVAAAWTGVAEAQRGRRPQQNRRDQRQAEPAEAPDDAKDGGQEDAPEEKAPEGDAEPAELRIEPKAGQVRPGEKMAFEAKAFDAEGNEVPAEPEWSALFGGITPNGEYTAKRREGGCIVTASLPPNSLKAEAHLLVTTADEDATGEIQVIRWNVERRTAFLARPDITVRFVGSDQARMARLFVHQKGGTVNQLQSATCREGRAVRFGFIFNPSAAERIEVVVFDFRNRALASVIQGLEEP